MSLQDIQSLKFIKGLILNYFVIMLLTTSWDELTTSENYVIVDDEYKTL